MSTYVLRKGVSHLSDLVDGAAAFAYPGDYPGKIYYVNNLTGKSANDGLSWDTAFDEISTAITASVAAHAVTAAAAYARNIIYVAGTSTGYGVLTALDSDISIIGVGRSPFGNGSGIPLIGTVSGGTTTPITTSAVYRGVEFYNLQFAFGTADKCGVNLGASFLRGKFVNCSFLNSGTASTGACLSVNAAFAGNLIEGCQFSGDAGYPAYGIYFAASITMNNNIIRDNLIVAGTSAAVYVGASVNDVNTVFTGNVIGAPAANDSAIGFDDNGPGYSYIVGNYVSGTDAMEISANAGNRVFGNFTSDNGTPAMEGDITAF